MKEFDVKIKEGKNPQMRVLTKQGQTLGAVGDEFSTNGTTQQPFENMTDIFHRLLRGGHLIGSALEHRLDRWTFGIFRLLPTAIWIKGSILVIIMFLIWYKPVASVENTGIFAGTKGKAIEKAQSNKQKKTNVTVPTAMASGVSFNLAPAAPDELKAPNVKLYIDHFSNIAVAEMDKFGIPASIIMAQAIIESRSGTSVLAVRNNNHFGIKCFSKTCKTGHCNNFTDDTHKDFFIKYTGTDGSWRAHSEFLLKQPRYRGLLKYGKNYKIWAKGLREFGYATDPTYDTKLIAIVQRYNLDKLDDL